MAMTHHRYSEVQNRSWLCAMLLLAATTSLHAADAPPATAPVLPTPSALTKPIPTTQPLIGHESDQAEVTAIPAPEIDPGTAMRIRIPKKSTNAWDIQFAVPTNAAINNGDALLVTFYVRTLEAQNESGEARFAIIVQRNSAPWTSTVEQELSAPRTWKKITFPLISHQSWPAGKAQLAFNLGFDAQTIDFAGVSMVNYGQNVKVIDLPQPQFTYAGREADAPWRAEAAARIEKYRKDDLAVTVVDEQGHPVPGATVSINMTKHAFGFGTALSATDLMANTPDGEQFRDAIQKYFNRVVMENDMKWRAWENVLRRKKTINAVKWLKNHGVDVRGHCMVWPGWPNLPDALGKLKKDPAAVAQQVDDHITEIAKAFAPFHLSEWDVINETRSNHDLQDLLGHQVIAHWFEVAHAAIPDVPLFLNENSVLEAGTKADFFYSELQYLVSQHAPLGGIGLQGHFGWNPTPPDEVIKRLDRFATFGVPIEITEFDMSVSDEKLQADYTRDVLTAVFSHPSTNGFIMWGFWDPRHWLGNAPLFRKDWSLKPSGQAWMDLVFNQWWTKTKVTAGSDGKCQTRGFLGDYDIIAEHDGKSVTVKAKLIAAGSAVRVVLK